jgi:hypothetical protein
VVLAVVLLAAGGAGARLPVAPPPRPSLAEVVREYQRLGLPLPPPDAELVRIEWWDRDNETPEGSPRESYLLGFRLTPLGPGSAPHYLFGTDGPGSEGYWSRIQFHPRAVRRAEPVPDALHLVFDTGGGFLCLAAQCELQGWQDLARAAYARARAQFVVEESKRSAVQELRNTARWFWYSQLLHGRGLVRKDALRRLRQLDAEGADQHYALTDRELKQWEATVNPPRSKPGSVEALIDDLTEYYESGLGGPPPPYRDPYWKLAARGFEAVPALIEHLDDERFSRTTNFGTHISETYQLTVGHLRSRLLRALDGRTRSGFSFPHDRLDPKSALKWYAAAKEVGEEKWLFDRAVPNRVSEFGDHPEKTIVRAIAARYPARLPEVYRAMLGKPAPNELGDFVEEVLVSKLPAEKKVALLEEGATHADVGHRGYALQGLARQDRALFKKHLLSTLKDKVSQVEGDKVWVAPSLVPLVEQANDRQHWDALLAAAKALPVDGRAAVLYGVGVWPPFVPTDPRRVDRLRFLVQFLNDSSLSTYENGRIESDVREVRDYVADRLAYFLGLPLTDSESSWVYYDPMQGPLSRFLRRALVAQAAAEELARLGKK